MFHDLTTAVPCDVGVCGVLISDDRHTISCFVRLSENSKSSVNATTNGGNLSAQGEQQ